MKHADTYASMARLNFKPYPKDLEYFKAISDSLTRLRGLDTRTKYREAFHYIVLLIRQSEFSPILNDSIRPSEAQPSVQNGHRKNVKVRKRKPVPEPKQAA